MKIYISIDMEGITGIVHGEQLVPEGKDYNAGRKLYMNDLQAAIDGAFDAGVDEILVNDAHGTMRNIIIEDLDERVKIIAGPASSKQLVQTDAVDSTFDGAFLLGFHAKAGTADGVMSHTWVGHIKEIRINGNVLGETGINGALFGFYKVPVLLATGDNALVAEIQDTMPWVRTVAVKEAIGRAAAICLPPKATYKLIRETARESIVNMKDAKPFLIDPPFRFEAQLITHVHAKRAAIAKGITLKDPYTLALEGDHLPTLVNQFWRGLEIVLSEPLGFLK
jgi:D-amino peptidase